MDDDGRRQTPGYAQERSWSIRSLVIWGGVGGTKRKWVQKREISGGIQKSYLQFCLEKFSPLLFCVISEDDQKIFRYRT